MQVGNSFAYAAPGMKYKESIQFFSHQSLIEIIQADVCEHWNMTPEILYRKYSKGERALPKQVFSFLLCKHGIHLVQIQQLFGYKDHTSIIYNREMIKAFLSPKGQQNIKEEITAFLSRYNYDIIGATVKTIQQTKGGRHQTDV